MTGTLIQFFLSATVITIAGIFLAKSSEKIGRLTNIGSLFAGIVLLAGATSLPELLVDLSAVQKEMPDLAVGDLLGSSLMNLLILAVADLIHKNTRKIFSRASAQHALSAAISINMTVLTCVFIFLGPFLVDFNIGDVGLGPIAIGISYILGLRLVYRDQGVNAPENAPKAENKKNALPRAIFIYLLAASAIFVAAPFLAESAGKIATLTGVGDTFIGSTLVALCTSLPELVSTITAVRMGSFDLAVGNIFGSNSFNMILLIPLDFVFAGNLLAAITQTHILTALAVILATSVTVMGQLYQVEKRKKFIEPDALTVIAIVLAALALIFKLG